MNKFFSHIGNGSFEDFLDMHQGYKYDPVYQTKKEAFDA